jgi:hypothetical protein
MSETEGIKSDFMFDQREFESTPLKLSEEPNVKSLRAFLVKESNPVWKTKK